MRRKPGEALRVTGDPRRRVGGSLAPCAMRIHALRARRRARRITPSGRISEFPLPTEGSRPTPIAASPNGDLWFGVLFGHQLVLVGLRLLNQAELV
jgi:hypothetical protein